jgi:hypothetical protein
MTRVFENNGRAKNLAGAGAEKGATVKTVAHQKYEKAREDKGVTLVDETRFKSRVSSTLHKTTHSYSFLAPLNLAMATGKSMAGRGSGDLTMPVLAEEDDQEGEWMMDSSPAMWCLILRTTRRGRCDNLMSGVAARKRKEALRWR